MEIDIIEYIAGKYVFDIYQRVSTFEMKLSSSLVLLVPAGIRA